MNSTTSFLLDDNNNLIYGDTFFEVNNSQRILQDIKTRLGMLKGENPFDTSKGTDYFIVLQYNDKETFINKIKKDIEDIEDIEDIIITYNTSNNTLTIKITNEGLQYDTTLTIN